ncbi:MAG: class I SAM-dependent methyltransferase [Candidatus Brocadiaceae bacterium]|jgi:ubiquinone/menaquinone biosynthesis C-methylase UbiE
MPRHAYPWWFHYAFENRLRRLLQQPEEILAPWVQAGMRCLEIGCGMGFFTIPLARMTQPGGRVVAVDVEPRLLSVLRGRAARAGVAEAIGTLVSSAERMRPEGRFGFALASWSLHETDDPVAAARRIGTALSAGARFLLAEPRLHVSRSRFRILCEAMCRGGLELVESPPVPLSHSALFAPSA